MGSSYFGMPNNMGTETRCSTRKHKKSKQPQRGLGVAQLEQIRLRSQMACGFTPPLFHPNNTNAFLQDDMSLQGGVSAYGVPQSSTSYQYSQYSPSSSTYAHHPNYMVTFGEERANLRYQDPHQSTGPRWDPNTNVMLNNSSSYSQAGHGISSKDYFKHFEESREKIDLLRAMGSRSQNSDTSEHEELDLELRLSI